MWTPLPVAEPSYSVAKWCAGGYVKQVPGDRRWKKTPGILNRLRALLDEDTAGDPTGRRGLWTGKHLRAISRELAQLGLRVCPNTVRRLLGQLDYALHAKLQKSLSQQQSKSRPTVPLSHLPPAAVQPQRLSDYQRGYQEKGVGGPVQEQRSSVESGADSGPRP